MLSKIATDSYCFIYDNKTVKTKNKTNRSQKISVLFKDYYDDVKWLQTKLIK